MRLVRAGNALVALLCVAASAALALTASGGALAVTHGVSMNPVYHQGDLVVVAPESQYAIGDIAAFDSPESDMLVLHRIIGGDAENGFVFQGDGNESVDSVTPTADELVGKPVLHVPGGGVWLRRLTSPPALAAYTFLLLTVGGNSVRTRRQRRKELRTMSPRHRAIPSGAVAGLLDKHKPVAAGAALVGLVGLTVSGVAWMRPAEAAGQASQSSGSSMVFSYTAQVPQSAAYDGTTVSAPQPVFRKLADSVEVGYRYAGPSGELSVAAELSTDSGWSSSVPLDAAVEVEEGSEGSVALDLGALEERAAAAAEVIGVPVGTVTVAVVPTVTLDGGESFAPRFEMSMDSLALKPVSELEVTESSAAAGTGAQPAQLSLLGRAVEVSTARLVGAVLLLVGVLGVAAAAAAARLAAPVAEAERVRRRHGDLILSVMPVALVAGRPVVDVPDVDSLVKLAERYGLLVLTWSRGGIDTYVVQDESTTYRYRGGTVPEPVPAAEQDLLVEMRG